VLHAKWKIGGEYMESCNCDYLCPCIYTNPQAPVTHDQCTSLQVYRIDDGHFGQTKLGGLAFALVIRSGRVMADGNWVLGVVIDERANEAQRDALGAIASGQAGGIPGRIREVLVRDFRGVELGRIEFRMDGLKRSAAIPGLLEFAIEGVASRAGNGDPLYLDNTSHPANRRLALARSSETHVHGFGLELDMTARGNNGHFAPFNWAG
jgi:hypothetical protein